jgi:transcriptional regulator with XRE-family HTH domain
MWDGSRLAEIREARGYSQPDLAEKSGVSVGDISRHETNSAKSNPAIATLGRLAVALRVPLDCLFQPVGSRVPRPEETGHAEADKGRTIERSALYEAAIAALDVEMPAEDTWRGDVLKAIAALNRALRRPDPGASTQPAAKVGR